MEIISLEEYTRLKYNLHSYLYIKEREDTIPSFGDIWICQIPILVKAKKSILFKKVNRPILIVDDTKEHLIHGDKRNYYGLKITSQNDSYQRVKLPNAKVLGLTKESYLRLEIPLKIEKEQFLYKIGSMSPKEVTKYISYILKIIDKNTLSKE